MLTFDIYLKNNLSRNIGIALLFIIFWMAADFQFYKNKFDLSQNKPIGSKKENIYKKLKTEVFYKI